MKTALTESRIQRILSGFLTSAKYDIDGLYVFDWESDKLLETKAGYIYEFEVKISRADFKNDFRHKADKHAVLDAALSGNKYMPKFWEFYDANRKNQTWGDLTLEAWEIYCRKHDKMYFTDYYKLPNYFYYAVPDGMVKEEEVPVYAGLVYITEDGTTRIIKPAPQLHKTKYADDELGLGEKFYYNMVTWRTKAREWERHYDDAKKDLQEELASRHQEMTYEKMRRELENVKHEKEVFQHLYYNMVYGADYNDIERHMLIEEIKKYNPDFDYEELMHRASLKYEEKYPNRK